MSVNSPEQAAVVRRDDTIAALLSALVVAGLYLDGWSHLNRYGGELGTFFTPWHGLLYAAFSSNAAWVVSRNRHLWHPELAPPHALFRVGRYVLRYPYAIFGLVIATVGMLGDLGWHTAFGEEKDVARVIAPFHIVLVLGAALLVLAPLRSAAHAPDVYPPPSSAARVLPAIVALALAACLASFVVQWVSPFVEWSEEGFRRSQPSMAAAALLATFTAGVPALLVLSRWPNAFGATTAIAATAAFAMASLGSLDVGWTVCAAAAGGAVADFAHRRARRLPAHIALYLAAALFPLVTWSSYFVILDAHYGIDWPADFVLGVAAFCALGLCAVTFVITLPDTS